MVRKKTLRLLLCDYQRTARCYTIYRTFKSWSSDDFTTISRLFQPGRYDYCRPLLAIGRKPEKRCGGSRQLFRAARRAPAAGLPRRPCPADRCQVSSRRAWKASRPRRADPCTGCKPDALTRRRWHGLRYAAPPGMDPRQGRTLIYLIIIGRLRWPVQRPAWRRWCIGGLCVCCIVCAGMGQIDGNAPVKPCKRFWRFGCIKCMDGIKAAVNACMGLYCSKAKQKPCTLSRCKAKEKPRHVGGVGIIYFFLQDLQGRRKALAFPLLSSRILCGAGQRLRFSILHHTGRLRC